MFNYQNKFKKLYNEINLQATKVNPNEAYTELLALTLMTLWEYNYLKKMIIQLNNL